MLHVHYTSCTAMCHLPTSTLTLPTPPRRATKENHGGSSCCQPTAPPPLPATHVLPDHAAAVHPLVCKHILHASRCPYDAELEATPAHTQAQQTRPVDDEANTTIRGAFHKQNHHLQPQRTL